MTPSEIIEKLQAQFPDAIEEAYPEDKHPRIHIQTAHWRPIAEFLASDEDLAFDWLGCITAVDYVVDDELASVYDLRSSKHNHWFAVKVLCDRKAPKIASVMDIWPAADWHEREAYDMMGIIYEGHSDFRRILLPEDWVGYPLRKDYEFPREYHGIPNSTEMDWQQKGDFPV